MINWEKIFNWLTGCKVFFLVDFRKSILIFFHTRVAFCFLVYFIINSVATIITSHSAACSDHYIPWQGLVNVQTLKCSKNDHYASIAIVNLFLEQPLEQFFESELKIIARSWPKFFVIEKKLVSCLKVVCFWVLQWNFCGITVKPTSKYICYSHFLNKTRRGDLFWFKR